MVCFLSSPIADQREAMPALAAMKSNKTANAAKSAGPANSAKKAMKATKAIEAMQKSRPNETKKPRVCRCMGCTNCFSARATLPKPPAPCKKTLHSGGLCSGFTASSIVCRLLRPVYLRRAKKKASSPLLLHHRIGALPRLQMLWPSLPRPRQN